MYALPGANLEASIPRTTPSGGRSGMFSVTSVQVAPPSRLTCIRPSLVPAQKTPRSTGDSSKA